MARRQWKYFLDPADKQTLEDLYVAQGVATDQLRRDHATLVIIARTFNQMTGRDDSTSDLLGYMINRRKEKDWPRLGDRAKKFPPVTQLLTDDQLEVLRDIYITLDVPSDQYICRVSLAKRIADLFHSRTGVRVSPNLLVAVIVAKRKRGVWVRIREAFDDLDEALGAG
jgi:hypothetical protein